MTEVAEAITTLSKLLAAMGIGLMLMLIGVSSSIDRVARALEALADSKRKTGSDVFDR